MTGLTGDYIVEYVSGEEAAAKDRIGETDGVEIVDEVRSLPFLVVSGDNDQIESMLSWECIATVEPEGRGVQLSSRQVE